MNVVYTIAGILWVGIPIFLVGYNVWVNAKLKKFEKFEEIERELALEEEKIFRAFSPTSVCDRILNPLEAPYSKAYRYPTILQHLNRHSSCLLSFNNIICRL